VLKLDLLQIMNHMYIEGRTTLTLLNTDYKILARIIANRIRLCLAAIHHPNQQCGIQVNSAFEAVATVRAAVAHAEVTKTPLRIGSIPLTSVQHLTKFRIHTCWQCDTPTDFLTGSCNA